MLNREHTIKSKRLSCWNQWVNRQIVGNLGIKDVQFFNKCTRYELNHINNIIILLKTERQRCQKEVGEH